MGEREHGEKEWEGEEEVAMGRRGGGSGDNWCD